MRALTPAGITPATPRTTYEIADLKELYPLVMEQEELANVGLKNRRHQC